MKGARGVDPEKQQACPLMQILVKGSLSIDWRFSCLVSTARNGFASMSTGACSGGPVGTFRRLPGRLEHGPAPGGLEAKGLGTVKGALQAVKTIPRC